MFEIFMFWTGVGTWVVSSMVGFLWAAAASCEWWLAKGQFVGKFLQWRFEQVRARSQKINKGSGNG